MWHNWVTASLLVTGIALHASATIAQEAIGRATSVRPQAEGSHGGNRTLAGGSEVYSKETLRTGDTGQADLRFLDNSNLNVGPKSNVRLDKFVYDPNKSAGARCNTGDPRLVSVCYGITGRWVLSDQDSLRHPRRARLTNCSGLRGCFDRQVVGFLGCVASICD